MTIPVVLDTDIGSDMDESWALAMLLGCPAEGTYVVSLSRSATDPVEQKEVQLKGRLFGHLRATDR